MPEGTYRAVGEPGGPEDAVDRGEGFGERLLGRLLDRAHETPPQLIAPLVAEEIRAIGGRDVSILLQDYAQLSLVPLLDGDLADGNRCRSKGRSPGARSFRRPSPNSGEMTVCACSCRCWTAGTRSA